MALLFSGDALPFHIDMSNRNTLRPIPLAKDLGTPITRALFDARLVAESPIESRMIDALYGFRDRLEKSGVLVYGQYKVCGFRVDLMFKIRGKVKLVVECDGAAYHKDKGKDAWRDAQLKHWAIEVMRFTGTDIWHSPEKCALEVVERLEKMKEENDVRKKRTPDCA